MNVVLSLPILIPLLAATGCLLAARSFVWQRWIGIAGSAAFLCSTLLLFAIVWSGGIQIMRVGNWPMPYGIVLVADVLSATMLLLIGIAAVAVMVYSSVAANHRREAFGYYPLFQFLLMGLGGGFLTGDIFNLYVWFELTLISSFVLTTLGGERAQLAGGLKYVALNLVSSAMFLSGLGLLYGIAGTLNMADLAVKLRSVDDPWPVVVVATFFLVSFAIKSALFPLFFWLPASYPPPPAPVTAFFAGSLTKLGAYSLLRTFTLIFTQESHYTSDLLLILAGVTMLIGVMGAIAQQDLRRVLAFMIVGHIGFVVMGLGLSSVLALTGSIFYIVHEVIAKTSLFLVAGLISKARSTTELSRLGGLATERPAISVMFLLLALSLSGLPPLSGFAPKLLLIRAGFDSGSYAIAAVALAASLLTLYAIARVWGIAFWGETRERDHHQGRLPVRMWMPCAVLTGLMLIIGLAPGAIFTVANRAARDLMNPASYISAVLKGGG